jgi:Uma2 family endonuclease
MMDTTTLVAPEALTRQWAELAQDEHSPEYYELTEYGELVLSPRAETDHQRLCTKIAFQIQSQLGDEAVVEAAVLTTTAGIRVPDVVWMPEERWKQHPRNTVLDAPDIVVEVLSPGNRTPEMDHKIHGYLKSGVKEVIVVGLTGTIEYIHPDGRHATSIFPLQLSLPAHLFA